MTRRNIFCRKKWKRNEGEMWKHLSKMTKLSCSGARKGHFVTCATREDVHYISTLENTSRSAKVPWGHAKWIHSTRIKYLKYTICCNLNTRSNMHPIVKINMLFASWEVRIGKNCDRGLEIAAFSRTMSQFFAIQTDPLLVNNFFFSSPPSSLKSLVLIVDSHRAW